MGNRNSRNVSGVANVASTSYATYDSNDRLGSTLANNTAASSFDANGNTLQFNLDGNGLWDYTDPDEYDFENRLITAHRTINNQLSTINIVYDGDGNRIGKTVNGVTLKYLIDDRNPTGFAQVLEEQDSSGTPIVTYVWGLGLAPVCQTRGVVTSYFGCDGQGTVRFLTFGDGDNKGYISDTYTFDAFGILISTATINNQPSTINNYTYTGQQWDSDLGMYYLRAKYDNPNAGRFWTMDTYEATKEEPTELHKYLYVAGNPLAKVDPLGEDGVDLAIGAMGVYSDLMAGPEGFGPIGSLTGTCGPEVSDTLKGTLDDVSASFAVWPFMDKIAAGDEMYDWLNALLGVRGIRANPRGAAGAWDIIELHEGAESGAKNAFSTYIGAQKTYSLGTGPWEKTVDSKANATMHTPLVRRSGVG